MKNFKFFHGFNKETKTIFLSMARTYKSEGNLNGHFDKRYIFFCCL